MFWRNELKINKFSLNYDKPIDFLRPQWQTSSERQSIVFLFYRWIFASLYVTTFTYAIISHVLYKGPFIYFPIYLTNWGNSLNAIYAVCTCAVVTCSFLSNKYYERMKHETQMPLIFKVIWFLQSICPVIAINITLLYWGFVHNKGDNEFPVDTLNILNHATNSAFMIIEILIIASPVRILHFIYPLATLVSFAVFTIIFYFMDWVNVRGQPYIYKHLDWNRPIWTGSMTTGVFVFGCFLHVCMFALYRLKISLIKDVSHTSKETNNLLGDKETSSITRNSNV
ncbi:protein rolling stone-like [Culicoides brevitarsis]|uniref:protein rolling stone-like n=1 Tax=Culicoides brevitarsis TaxID=469753 RepID=UPI00307B4F4A